MCLSVLHDFLAQALDLVRLSTHVQPRPRGLSQLTRRQRPIVAKQHAPDRTLAPTLSRDRWPQPAAVEIVGFTSHPIRSIFSAAGPLDRGEGDGGSQIVNRFVFLMHRVTDR